MLFVLCSVVVGCVLTWWVTVAQRVPVFSDADLASVRFGFPFPWVTQEHTSNAFTSYPQEVVLRLTGRTGISYPTDYEWLPFLGDALIWGGVFWVLGMLVLPAVVRVFRANRP